MPCSDGMDIAEAQETAKTIRKLKERLDLATRLLCELCHSMKDNKVFHLQSDELKKWALQHWADDMDKGLFPHQHK